MSLSMATLAEKQPQMTFGQTYSSRSSSNCQSHGWKWRPTSEDLLAQAEDRVLKPLKGKYIGLSIPVLNRRIWTIKLQNEKNPDKIPLVMVHGFGGGVGLWTQNLAELSKHRPVYALDLPGFARSCRSDFNLESTETVERDFVECLEGWRKEVNLKKFILLGHSFGGYLSSAYSLNYPDRVKHLILVDPWGMNDMPSQQELNRRIPLRYRLIAYVVSWFNPLGIIRAVGPAGPSLIRRFRSDLQGKFDDHLEEDSSSILEYIYHCNAQSPSGEIAFKYLSQNFGWAKNPMVHRMQDIEPNVPITMIYGSESWMDKKCAYAVKDKRKDSFVDIQTIKDAGHHVYADKPDEFNKAVNDVADLMDKEQTLSAKNISIVIESSV